MKRIVNVVLVISFIFTSLASRAESDIENISQFKIASLQLLSSFSAFIYFEGDELNRSRLNQAQANGDNTLSNISNPSPELSQKWLEIFDYLKTSQGRQFDVNLEAGWSILQEELNQIIILQEAKAVTPKSTIAQNSIIQLQIKMESVLSRYMAFANSTWGGYGVSSQGVPLEEEIKAVTLSMAGLVEQDAKYKPLAKKWGYIEKTLLAYNSNVAPFVVMHTFDKMRTMIASY